MADEPRRPTPSPSGASTTGGAAAQAADAEKADSVVRVDFRRLDALLEVLGEGLIQHSALAEAYRALSRRSRAGEELARLDRPSSRSRRRSSGSNPP